MRPYSGNRATPGFSFALALVAGLALPLPVPAALVDLATSPLATSTTSSVKPNLLFILDNSGSMDWDHMPDDDGDGGSAVSFNFGYYGFRSSQCNQVYYNPATTYLPPVDAAGTSYTDSSFTSAEPNGFNTSGTNVNLSSGFKAVGESTGQTAYYYTYSGAQDTQQEKNYHSTTNTFYSECGSAQNTSPGQDVFTKVILTSNAGTEATLTVSGTSSTSVSGIKVNGAQEIMSGTTAASSTSGTVAANIAAQINLCTAAKVGNCTTVGGHGYTASVSSSTVTITGLANTATTLTVTRGNSGTMSFSPTINLAASDAQKTNFANWYSFYRDRMLMMKTAAGRAFSSLNNSYRVGLMKISQTNPVVYMDTFEGAHRASWYSALYGMGTDGSTPLRRSLSDAGRYYAGKLSGADPVQYSCQQNFTILSTDGYWNEGSGYRVDGSTAVGNQDGILSRPFYDGSDLGSARNTSQIRKTQTQVRQSTSQTQQRIVEIKKSTSNLQRQTSQLQTRSLTLQARTSNLQSSTMYLQTRSRASSSSAWTAWSDTASCTWDTSGGSRRSCRYVTAAGGSTVWNSTDATWVNTPNCDRNYSTNTSHGTTWSGNGTDCRYLDGTWSNVASCTPIAKDTTEPYNVATATECQTVTSAWVGTSSCTPDATTECQTSITSPYANASSCTENATPDGSGNTTQCRYTAFTSYAYASSCNEALQDTTNPYDMTETSGVATQCQNTDTGWVGVSTCSGTSSPAGYTRTCQTNDTGPTLVSSCTPASKSAGNNYTQTSCNTTTILAAAPVASCTAETASAANNYVTTTCNTVTSGPTTGSCTPAAASAANDWTTTTCTSVVTGGGSSNNLADIAMYYYQTDLRNSALGNCTGVLGENVCENNVFIGGNDSNTQQHMTTFTLGLGASGKMNYSPSYLTDTSGDYYDVRQGNIASSTACTWQTAGTTCNWPIPGMSGSNGLISNIDDLWHAAVNGRGAYFSATDPASLSSGLSNALAGINARKGSAAAAATSTLNPVAGNNYAYVASYTTVIWKGNLEARGINTATGAVNENATWCVENVVAGTCATPGAVVAETIGDTTVYNCVTPNSVTCTGGTLDGTDCKVPVATACTGTMNTKVADVTDTRAIKTANNDATALVDFTYANLTAGQQAYFAAGHIGTLSQWSTLSDAQKTAAAGLNLVNYLRGQNGYEVGRSADDSNHLYRYREAVLGDALESQPAFIGKPVFGYPYPGYNAYKTAQSNRAGTVYMGANDGMMHAFAADTGIERWAYVPSMVIPNMWKLADTGYATAHRNFVNGSPITSDICTANCSNTNYASTADTADDPIWKTILVAGLNGGGRGYYALDITAPDTPALLWEFTPATGGTGSVTDDDLGYSFGQPIITRKADGTWVVLVTSGYNNTSPGNGKGYLYVLNAATGAIVSKIATNAGTTTTPSGLAKIAGWNNEPAGNQAGYIYGGDLLGNVWRFDINSTVTATVSDGEIGTGDVMQFAILKAPSGTTQPVTTTPVLGKIADKRVVFVGTGKYLETADLTTTQVQTQYAIKDDDATATLVNPRNSLVQQTLSNNPDGTATRLTTGNAVNFYTGRGWYVDFPDSGERVNIDAKLVQGTLLAPSIVPSNTACSPGGYGWLNFFDYKTGGAINTATDLASLKYDATIVGVNVLYVQGQPKVGVVTSTNPTPVLNEDVGFAATAAGFSGKRVIWRELIP